MFPCIGTLKTLQVREGLVRNRIDVDAGKEGAVVLAAIQIQEQRQKQGILMVRIDHI